MTEKTFSRELQIEWGDCDPAGIVFFPRYLAFFDASTAYLFESVGLPKPQMIKHYGIVGIPLVDVHAKFSAPSRYGERVTIVTRVAEWRRSSFVVEHKLLRGETLAVECQESRVWAVSDPERAGAIRAQAIPPDVIERFRA
jgi:4-hydroxybenzoyl-CoA thioesterase